MTYIIAIETALILLILFVSLSFTIPKLVITSSFDIPDITIYYSEAKLEIYHDDDINPTQITFECQDASTNNLEELSKVITVVGKYFAMIKI